MCCVQRCRRRHAFYRSGCGSGEVPGWGGWQQPHPSISLPPFSLSRHQPFHFCSFLPSTHYRPCDKHRYLLSKHEGGSPTELLVTAFAFAARVDRRCSPHSAACDNAELRSILQYPIGLLLRLHAERAQLVLRPRMWLFAFFCLIAEHTYIRTCGRFATESFAFKEALSPLTRTLSIA